MSDCSSVVRTFPEEQNSIWNTHENLDESAARLAFNSIESNQHLIFASVIRHDVIRRLRCPLRNTKLYPDKHGPLVPVTLSWEQQSLL